MILKQVYNTEHKSQILIDLPEKFRKKKKVLVVIDDSVDEKLEKMELMQKAQTDNLFIEDVNAVTQDFDKVDIESL